jgi:hypothetical protein
LLKKLKEGGELGNAYFVVERLVDQTSFQKALTIVGYHRSLTPHINSKFTAVPTETTDTTDTTDTTETTVRAQLIRVHNDYNGEPFSLDSPIIDGEGHQSELVRLVCLKQVSSFVLKCLIVF